MPGRAALFKGTVTEVRNSAHVVQDVVTYGVVVEVDNLDLALRPGMTASVRVRTGFTPATLQVPNAALRFTPPAEAKSESPRVWLMENGALVARPVHPGLTDGEQTALAAGDLPPGHHGADRPDARREEGLWPRHSLRRRSSPSGR